jgi:MoaA/NifB/PqqE/SkfB family radical SAM enzyme
MITPYCTAPWNGITIRENGDVKTCCEGNVVLGNINDRSIVDIIADKTIIKIKQDLLIGNLNNNCSSCQELEKKSGSSLRRHYNTYYPTLSNELKFLDIRWSNLCNLRCIYCTSDLSSSWAEKLSISKVIKVVKHNYDQQLEEWILKHADQLQELLLVGGEPLLMKQNYALIKQISNNTRLSIITNLTYDLKNNPVKDILFNRPPDNTIWNISVENYEKQFEYVRTGAKWIQFKENIELLVNNNPNNIQLLMVYGIFSALTLFDTVKYYYSLGCKKIQVQPLNENDAMNVFNLPIEILKVAYDQIIQTIAWRKEQLGQDYAYYASTGLEDTATHLKKSMNDPLRKIISEEFFVEEIKRYDESQSDKFSDLWSTEYKLIINSFRRN